MVYYHRIGTPQSADELVFRDEKNPQRFHTLQHDRGRALRGARRLRSRHRQAGQRRVRAGPVEAGLEVHAADSGRSATTPTTCSKASAASCWSSPTTTRRTAASSASIPAKPGAGELEDHPAGKARHHRHHRGRRRQGDRDLHEGRRLEGLRPQPRRRARERSRAAGPGQRQRLRRQHGRHVAVLHVHVVHLSDVDLPLRSGGAEELAVPRAGDSRASTPISTRPSRCSSPARTARRCRCSSCTRRAWCSTATTRR